jgi:putative Ca2+/H+ antiporter (TMEM165/GDT1 family)
VSWWDSSALAVAFAVIFLAELPDKTMVATVVLATRYRRLPVWLGVAAALGLQTLIAVTAGGLLSLLPPQVTLTITAVLFTIGAVYMIITGVRSRAATPDQGPSIAQASSFWRMFAISFGVLFAAEWGDLSQLFTAGLAAQSGAPLSVFLGAWAALLLVSGLAVLLGTWLSQRLPLWIVRVASGLVLSALAVWTIVELITTSTS